VRNSWNKEPYAIRRMLTETSIRASDRRAVFVGIDAYEVAGGVVLRDLFQGDNGGWLEDPALLDRPGAEKLRKREFPALVPEVSDRICNHTRAFGSSKSARAARSRSRPLWG
jgi:ParB family chromosome partitioning protein